MSCKHLVFHFKTPNNIVHFAWCPGERTMPADPIKNPITGWLGCQGWKARGTKEDVDLLMQTDDEDCDVTQEPVTCFLCLTARAP